MPRKITVTLLLRMAGCIVGKELKVFALSDFETPELYNNVCFITIITPQIWASKRKRGGK